jgi:alpha-1,6-mannosyltransferase
VTTLARLMTENISSLHHPGDVKSEPGATRAEALWERRFRPLILLALAALLEFCFLKIVRLTNGGAGLAPIIQWAITASIFYLIAVGVVLWPGTTAATPGEPAPSKSADGLNSGRRFDWSLLIVATSAVLFRLTLLPAYPTLSHDLYRYRWEGKIQTYGFNPYGFAPGNTLYDPIRSPDDRLVTQRTIASVYPPIAEKIFKLDYELARGIRLEKLPFVAFDLLTLWLLVRMLRRYGLAETRAAIYGWCPLVVIEIAGNGHVDSVAIFLVVLGFYLAGTWDRLATLAITAAVLTRYFPIALLPEFLAKARKKRWGWMAGLTGISFLPYLFIQKQSAIPLFLRNAVEFVATHHAENASIFTLLLKAIGSNRHAMWEAMAISLAAVGGTAAYAAMKREQWAAGSLLIVGVLLALAPNVFPWYALWLVPFTVFRPTSAGLYFLAAALLGYFALTGGGSPGWSAYWLLWEYVPAYALLGLEAAFYTMRRERRTAHA